MSDEAVNETPLRVLVVDDRWFQRRLISDTLRSLGRVHVEHAATAEECEQALERVQPDILILDWDLDGGRGLALVQRIRGGALGEAYRKLAIILVGARNKESEIERARNAGVDEFVLRPFSTSTMLSRVIEVRDHRREWVESAAYVGPCRRRRASPRYDGPRRRLFDTEDKNADEPDVQIRKGLARTYVERLTALMREFGAGDREALRVICLACGQLNVLAESMEDRLLMSATSSLFSYLKGVGADAAVNAEVVQAHLDAILQLAELPNYQSELRRTVTQELGVMVTKKLRHTMPAA
jgi:CheY-like chemotaxis protein